MTDVKNQPTSLEDIGAGLLNGAMVTLLGAVLPCALIWRVLAQLSGWLPDLEALSLGLPPIDINSLPAGERRALIHDSLTALPLLLASFWAIRWGVGHIRENLTLLRARRG